MLQPSTTDEITKSDEERGWNGGKMGRLHRNVIVKTRAKEGVGGFDILLDFSGFEETVCHHRHDGLLHEVIKDGIRLDRLMAWRPSGSNWVKDRSMRRRRRTRQQASVEKVVETIEKYLKERDEICGAQA